MAAYTLCVLSLGNFGLFNTGTWMYLPTYFLQNAANGELLGPDNIAFDGMFRTTVSVNYGTLDYLNLEQGCHYVLDPSVQTCTKSNLDLLGALSRLNFNIYKDEALPRRDIVIYGDFRQTLLALSNVSYLPRQYQNTQRLTLTYYNPTTALIRPYETLNITIEFASSATCFIDATIAWWARCSFKQLAALVQVCLERIIAEK